MGFTNASAKEVYFDKFSINVYKGALEQENHYYPYGLTVNMASSATGVLNRNKYQGKEQQEDLGFNLYDFTARQYDPQLGRFWGVDPASQFPSGYTGMGNGPSNMVDPSGCVTHGIGGSDPSSRGTYSKNGAVTGNENPGKRTH